MVELAGKVALVTGASSGIGRATTLTLARADMRVLAVARREDLLAALDAEAGGAVRGLVLDVRMLQRAEEAVGVALRTFGRLDVLVNCAGAHLWGPVAEIDPDAFADLLRTNVLAPAALIRAAVPVMRSQGSGAILNISSLQGDRAMPRQGAYGASKHALNALTEALRIELAGSGIRVVTFVPDPTATGFAGPRPTEGPAPRRWSLPRLPRRTPDDQARKILEVIRSGREGVVYASLAGLGVARVAAAAPGLVDWVYSRRGLRGRPGA